MTAKQMATECIATCSALTAGSGARDMRCILYTCVPTSGHTYAKVSSGQNVAFAQLRRQETGSTLSCGLQEALEVKEGQNQVSVQVESSTKDGNDSAGCKCRCGVVASVRMQFLDRPRPRSAVIQGLQRIAAQLLDGAVVWRGRRSSVNWLNCRDRVEFVDVKWGSTGSGCCHQLGTTSSTSHVSLTFAGSPVVLHAGLTFEFVDTYVERIARELGGVEKYARCLLQSIVQRLGMQKEKKGTLQPSVGALVSGLPGIGKTALSREICKCLGVTTIFLNAADIFQTYVGQSEQQLVKIFESAVLQSPSILLIDGIEAIAGSRRALTDSRSALEIGVLGVLLSYLEKIKSLSHRVFVLGTTTRPGEVDAAVVSNGRLDQAVRIEPPTQIERLAVLRIITKPWRSDKLDDSFLTRVSESTGGFVGADLLCLCQKALQVCLSEGLTANVEGSAVVCPRHVEQALAVTNPSVLQTHHVSQKQQQPASTSIQKHNYNQASDALSSVFGMHDAIETLRVSLIEPLGDCSRFLRFGTTPPKGILLTGPPGSGKTYLANAVAEQVRRRGLASFVSVECSDLLTKIVGDTEKALRELFDTARNAAPCVLYFDQIESIAPIRGFDTSTEQTFDRMLSMLLVEMDGFSTSRTKLQHSLTNDEARMVFLKQHVVILASTTNKELLDPAILRPGRFDVHIHIDFPDEDARCAIILQALETVPVDYSTDAALGSREALARHMAKHTAGLSAGDVNAVLREAAMASMRNDLSSTTIRMKYVLQALGEVASRAASSSPMATPLFARHDRHIDETKHSSNIRRAPGRSDQARRKTAEARRILRSSYVAHHVSRLMRAESRRPTPHLGALAHARNRYKHRAPDFYALGQQYTDFRQYLRNVDDVNCRASLAWDDPFAVRELTKTLLLHDFGLHWEIPINQLCPPLPNRLNYLHWIEDLLSQADWSKFVGQEQDLKTTAVNEETVSGIDVGTGANCIYALLGATMNKWRFIATEIDAESFACAKENVSRNHLEAFISVKRTHTNRLLAEPLEEVPLGHKFHFVMCNPPFFDNMDEADTNPESSCMGSNNEMVFPGGEVAFIGRMIVDSKDLQNRVLWFTSMVGRKASLRKLLALLRETKVRSTRTTEFFQGRTKRWGIAWTFAGDVADTLSVKVLGKRKEAHRRQELRFRLPLKSEEAAHGCTSVAEVHMRIREFVDSADGLQLLTESKGPTNQGTEHEESRDRQRFRLEQHKPNQETPDDGLTQVHCAGRVDVLSLNDNEGGFEVSIAFEEGKRAAFWTIADMLQAATIRTGRQWRRALRQQQHHQ